MMSGLNQTRSIAVLIILVLVVLASWFAPIDKPAIEQVDAGMKRAFVTFASARALNAAISLAQGTELNLGAGASVTLSIGEVLDPVNDLVEQFSNFMLAATVAFGVQKVLLAMGQYEYVKLLLTVLAVSWAGLYVSKKKVPRWLSTIFLLMLMVRFAVPVVTVGTDALFQRFLARDYQVSQAAIDETAASVKQTAPIQRQPEQDEPGLMEKLKNWSPSSLDPRPHVDRLKEQMDKAAQHVVDLIVIFLLQTLVIPLLLLWGLYITARSLIVHRREAPEQAVQ